MGGEPAGVLSVMGGEPGGVLCVIGGEPAGVLGVIVGEPERVLGESVRKPAGLHSDIGGVPTVDLGRRILGGEPWGDIGVVPSCVLFDIVGVEEDDWGDLGGVPNGVLGSRILGCESSSAVLGDSWDITDTLDIELDLNIVLLLISLYGSSSWMICVVSNVILSSSPWKSFLLTFGWAGDGLRCLFFVSLYLKLVKR